MVVFRKTWMGKRIKAFRAKSTRLLVVAYQAFHHRHTGHKPVLLIFGSQRSGTTLMGEVFAKDLRTAVLQERSAITRPGSLRLRPIEEINEIIKRMPAAFVVAKPLVESQWAPELVAGIEGAKALWMFRQYRDVVNSSLRQFTSQVEGLRIAVSGEPPDWRNERTSVETDSICRRYLKDDMRRADAAALGWYRRNVLFFELGLDSHPQILLVKYEEFVADPERIVRRIYGYCGVDVPVRDVVRDVDRTSVNLGVGIEIDPPIDKLCSTLYQRMNDVYDRQLHQLER